METERRRFPRYRFVATVHIKEILSEAELIARTSNISFGGCLVKTRTPLAAGTPVRITISHQGMTFKAFGNVAVAIEGVGMPVSFETFSPDQEAILRTWIDVVKQRSGSRK
jgi:hypothetical protein